MLKCLFSKIRLNDLRGELHLCQTGSRQTMSVNAFYEDSFLNSAQQNPSKKIP